MRERIGHPLRDASPFPPWKVWLSGGLRAREAEDLAAFAGRVAAQVVASGFFGAAEEELAAEDIVEERMESVVFVLALPGHDMSFHK